MSLFEYNEDNSEHILENMPKIDVSDIMEATNVDDALLDSEQTSQSIIKSSCNNVDALTAGLKWSREAVACLLQFIKEYQQQLNDKKLRKSTVWEAIAKRLSESGFQVGASQCDQKWRNMNKRYKEYLRDVSMGRISKTSKHKRLDFAEDLEQLLGDKFVEEDVDVHDFEIGEDELAEESILILPCTISENEDETFVEQEQNVLLDLQPSSNHFSCDNPNKRKKEADLNIVLESIRSSVENQTKAIYALIEHNKRQSKTLIETLRRQHQEDMKWKKQILEVLDCDSKLKENAKKSKT